MNPPSGVVTFLFTDIEGSTRRWDSDPDAMRTALAKHDDVFTRTIAEQDGWLFKHTGDGVCAVFSSPHSAVETAVAAQRALQLPVRMGIATGEAELRGDDYFGAVLNRAARVMDAGHGGQVLLDGPTAGLLTGVELVALGYKRLRDIARPVELFQVRATGLPGDFPALRTVDASSGNVRPRTTSFIGRDADLTELQDLLKAHQLVTLTGVGGVGKTRLALELGARAAGSYPDGSWIVELAAVGDPAAVPEAVATAMGMTQQPGKTLSDSVAAALDGRSRLIIFDNCEHVLDAAADMIEIILSRSDSVRIVATSREGLRIEDEQLWTVPSLDTDAGLDSAAASLFVDRARTVARGVSLTPHSAVVEICERLDGIPLAIELAASRMQSMSVVELRDRLDDRFRLLVGSRRGLERHQTLRHAVQWSYDLLDDREKDVLSACSVFVGGFDLPAVCAVTSSGDEFSTLDGLDALVRKSLLGADPSSDHTRFSMLETVRQFAEEQLVSSGAAVKARDLHARYFAAALTDVMVVWDSSQQREANDWFDAELPNLRAAFRWAADHDDLDSAAAIAVYATIIGVCTEQYEPISWAEELIDAAEAAEHHRLVQVITMAAQCYTVGRVADGIGYVERARAAAARGDFDETPFGFEAAMYGAYTMNGQPAKAVDLIRTVIARTPSYLIARACLATSLVNAGAPDAMEAAESLLPEADAAHNLTAKCLALWAYCWVCRDVDPTKAYDVSLQALEIATASRNRFVESNIAHTLARLAVLRGDPEEALDHLVFVIRRYQDSGSFVLLHGPLASLAAYLDQIGQYESAATIMGFAAIPIARMSLPEVNVAMDHLREVLGDQRYDALAETGQNMASAALVNYAFELVDRLRADLASAHQ